MTPAAAEAVGWCGGIMVITICIVLLVMSERKKPTSMEEVPWRQLLAIVLFVLGILLLVTFLPFCLRTMADPNTPTTLLK